MNRKYRKNIRCTSYFLIVAMLFSIMFSTPAIVVANEEPVIIKTKTSKETSVGTEEKVEEKKEVLIKEIKPLENIEIEFGLSEDDLSERLPKEVTIVDSSDHEHNVNVTWSMDGYSREVEGTYELIGTFELPEGITNITPEVPLTIKLKVIVKAEVVEVVEDEEWNIKDFKCDGTSIRGFSQRGKDKCKTNKDLILPEVNEDGEAITEISAKAFFAKKGNIAISSVNIPNTVTTIGKQAFAGNSLTSVQLPVNLVELGDGAFLSNNLTDIVIPEGVKIIPIAAFSRNKLAYVTIPEGVETIGQRSFSNNALQDIIIPNSVKVIDRYAFEKNQLESLIIPEGVNRIGNNAFKKNKLKSVNITADVEDIEEGAFDENVTLIYGNSTETIKEIKELENVEVELGVSEEELTSRLPKEVTIVDSSDNEHNVNVIWSMDGYSGDVAGTYEITGTFELPEGITNITPEVPLTTKLKLIVKSEVAEDKDWNINDFICNGTVISGFSESGKEKFKSNKDLILPKVNNNGQAITEIGNKAFSGEYNSKQNPDSGINSINIPDTVTTIGEEAFRYNALTHIDIPDSVTTIKKMALNGNLLKSLVIPDSVTTLEVGAFTLNKIEDLKLPKGLTTIPPAFAFNNLTTVTIPEGVIRIDDLAFSDNKLSEVNLPSTLRYLSGLNNNEFTSIQIPENVTEIGQKAFASNWFKSVVIPGNVKVIGSRAFWNTWHDKFLTTVIIEEGVEKIGPAAFSNNHIKEVQLPGSIKELSKDAFSNNLGYEGVVHVFTLNHEDKSNFRGSKHHVINPAKIIVKYVFGDKVLKEKELWKNDENGEYFYIGDNAVEITPEYTGNEYELKDHNPIKVDLNDKDNVVMVQCKKKDVLEAVKIKSIGSLGDIAVDGGTDKEVVMYKLEEKTFILDSNDKKHEVELTWTIEGYNENKTGEYTAIGRFQLPEGVTQSEPETKLEVQVKVLVRESFQGIQDSVWKVEDFNYYGTVVSGFSEQGKEKLKTNKDLVLPRVNKVGKGITNIGERAFENMGLTSLVIPEGVKGLVIEASAFKGNHIKKVFIPEGVREILTRAFYENDLRSVDFPGTIKKIGNQAFANNKLIFMKIGEGLETICLDSFSFYNNELTSVTILKEVKKVHEEAFKDNKGCEEDNNKVNVFVRYLNSENNGLFELSEHHKIILLDVEGVQKVKPLEVTIGTSEKSIGLPKKVMIKLNNGDIEEVSVTWKCEEYNANKAREYIFTGTYQLSTMRGDKKAINVKVKVKEASVVVTEKEKETETEVGTEKEKEVDKYEFELEGKELPIDKDSKESKLNPGVVPIIEEKTKYLIDDKVRAVIDELYKKYSVIIADFVENNYVLKRMTEEVRFWIAFFLKIKYKN